MFNNKETSNDLKLHEGHRGRKRKQIAINNFENMDDYEILEFVLWHCIPRRDTNLMAHKLIQVFGSFANVCDASVEDIVREGFTQNTATFLHSIPYMFERYKLNKSSTKACITCAQDLFDFLGEAIYHLPLEKFYVICMDNANNVLNYRAVAIGGASEVVVKYNDIIKFGTSGNTKKVVLVHNHPASSEEPSYEDIQTTNFLYQAFRLNNITLTDHMIVSGVGEYFSFAQSGWITKFKNNFENGLKFSAK